MADSMALALLGIKGYDIESIEDAYGKDKHYKKISLKYSGEIPDKCPVCGQPFYKHGTRRLQINDTPLTGCPVVLDIEIPRMNDKEHASQSSKTGQNPHNRHDIFAHRGDG